MEQPPLPPEPRTSLPSPEHLTNFNRLSLPFPLRLPLLTLATSTIGFMLGLTHGSTEAGLRFRAENAHRLPSTQAGWYLYHKSKNYHVILGGLYEGWRMAARMGVWAGVFVVMEEGVDRGRSAVVRRVREIREEGRVGLEGREEMEEGLMGGGGVPRDFISTTLAGLGTAGAFSAWNRFPLPTAVRLAKMGAKAGLGFGLVQDVVSLLKGRRLGYVEFLKRHTFGTDDRELREAMEAKVG